MKKYKLLKPISSPLYSVVPSERTKEDWLKLIPIEWLDMPEWFSVVNTHPTKEEIVVDVFKNGSYYFRENKNTEICTIFEKDLKSIINSCMDKYAESIKEQLIEKVEKLPPQRAHVERQQIIDIIKNFKAE